MQTQYDENVLDSWKLPSGDYIVKLKKDDSLKSDTDSKITMPAHLGSFILKNCERTLNNLIREKDGFKTNNVFYSGTDSLYIDKKALGCVGYF